MPKKEFFFNTQNIGADKPSRFVVDLKPNDKEEKNPRIKRLLASGSLIRQALFRGRQLASAARSGGFERLAVFSGFVFIYRLVRLGLKLIFYISYAAGWIMVFTVKFIYNLSFAAAVPIIRQAVKIVILMSGPAHNGVSPELKRLKEPGKILPRPIRFKKIDWKNLAPKPNQQSLKSALIFLALIFGIVVPIKAYTYYKSKLPEAKSRVLGASVEAISNITSAGQALSDFNFKGASRDFTEASENFIAAEEKVSEINGALLALAGLVGGPDLKLASEAKNILSAGQHASRLGSELAGAMNILFSLTDGSALKESQVQDSNPLPGSVSEVSDEESAARMKENSAEQKALADILMEFQPKIRQAGASSRDLNASLAGINSENVPQEQRDQFTAIKKTGKNVELMLSDLDSLTEILAKLLGVENKKRYLLVFQNNAEMRGSGGFIGSYAILDMDKGKIDSLEVPGGGGYDTKGALTKLVAAPEALRLLGPRWFFWDANWWPDWPTSARKLAWFYENSDGSSVDGVIGLTPAVMEKILEITGPVDLTEEYGVEINAENFWLETQSIAESDSERASGKPKKIIGDMMKKIIDRLPQKINKENLVQLSKAMQESLDQKQILIYLADPGLQAEIEKFGWDGKMNSVEGDYLLVANTNLGGAKSDKVIKETIIHHAEISSDGAITDTLRITRTHLGIKGEAFTGARNVNWMRIYVPEGSELLDAYGFNPPDQSLFKISYNELTLDPDLAAGEGRAITENESGTKIYQELGKTVFANWSQLDPGDTADIIVKYRLPFKLSRPTQVKSWVTAVVNFLNPYRTLVNTYSLTVQKQPGSENTSYESYLDLDENMKIIWHYPEKLGIMENGWQTSGKLKEDVYSGVLLETSD